CVHHAHAALTYKSQYVIGVHNASAYAAEERKYLGALLNQPFIPSDPRPSARMDVLVLETRWLADPYGQLGLSVGFWNFDHATAVGNGIWWGLDWTQGSREMITKFISTPSIAPTLNPDFTYTLNDDGSVQNRGTKYGTGTGKLMAVSAEYDASIARILWYPRNFDGRSADIRVAIAGIGYRTLDTDDPIMKNASGYYAGTEI